LLKYNKLMSFFSLFLNLIYSNSMKYLIVIVFFSCCCLETRGLFFALLTISRFEMFLGENKRRTVLFVSIMLNEKCTETIKQ
jgi:NADH:ubiquinone oxidoreductase subunit B-like Fe-S oxidoreductase